MRLDNMTGITKGSYTGADMFCKSQLITCNRVKECNGVCPFEDALKHADKEMDEQTVINHDRDWIIGCIEHDGFIHTNRFDKANQIILDALSAEAVQGWIPVEEQPPVFPCLVCDANGNQPSVPLGIVTITDEEHGEWHIDGRLWDSPKAFVDGEWGSQLGYGNRIIAWMPLPEPYKEADDEN